MFDTKKNRNVDKNKHLLVFFMKNFDINTRIKELIDFLKLKNNEFAREIGISSSRMSNVSTNRNKPDAEMLQLILRKYTNVSARWLLIGSGEMLIREQPSEDDPQNNNLYRLLKKQRQHNYQPSNRGRIAPRTGPRIKKTNWLFSSRYCCRILTKPKPTR